MPADTNIAANCRRLRISRGLSQNDAADQAGLSRAGYVKIETGGSVPRADTLEQLARVFGVSMEELFRPIERLHGVRFRSKKRLNSRDEILSEVKQRLERYNDLLGALGKKPKVVLPAHANEPERAAVHVRAEMLDKSQRDEPIHDICGLVEARGIKLFTLALKSAFIEAQDDQRAEGFFGLSVLAEGGGPAIVVNDFERISVERRIFTVAHELGHLVMHRGEYDAAKEEENERVEREANQFASHFLMPDGPFRKEWEQARGLDFVRRVFKVKRIFRVSYKTVLMRVGEHTNDKFLFPKFQALHKRLFGRTLAFREEPAPLNPADFQLDRLPSLVREGVEKEVFTQSRAAEVLGVTLAEFRRLAQSWDPPPTP